MLLSTPSQKIEATTAASTDGDFLCLCVYDVLRVTPKNEIITKVYAAQITNSPAVIILPQPSEAGVSHRVKELTFHNKDTISHDLTVIWWDGGSAVVLRKQLSIAANSSLYYSENTGWEYQPLEPHGYALSVQALTSSPTDSQTVYFGTLPKAPVTAAATSKVYIRKAGILKIAEIYCYSGTAGSNESWSLYVRVNNTTDYLIATLGVSASERVFSNTALSITLNVGDYIEIKGIQPAWGTNPLTTIYGGYIYIE